MEYNHINNEKKIARIKNDEQKFYYNQTGAFRVWPTSANECLTKECEVEFCSVDDHVTRYARLPRPWPKDFMDKGKAFFLHSRKLFAIQFSPLSLLWKDIEGSEWEGRTIKNDYSVETYSHHQMSLNAGILYIVYSHKFPNKFPQIPHFPGTSRNHHPFQAGRGGDSKKLELPLILKISLT
uniref:Uncharacterized protein n=1 Tax=Steinernema glaseri TaxID=37863 RepID=A0A1I8AES1_9BILA